MYKKGCNLTTARFAEDIVSATGMMLFIVWDASWVCATALIIYCSVSSVQTLFSVPVWTSSPGIIVAIVVVLDLFLAS